MNLLFCQVICDAAEVIHWAVRTVETQDQRDPESFRIRVRSLHGASRKRSASVRR